MSRAQAPTSVAATTSDKAPRTARGERTLRKILTAALEEFGERGFSDASIVGITSRAKVALGTFYTYFDSKEEVFQALVRDMSAQVRDHVAPTLAEATDGLDGERTRGALHLCTDVADRSVELLVGDRVDRDADRMSQCPHEPVLRVCGSLRHRAGVQIRGPLQSAFNHIHLRRHGRI